MAWLQEWIRAILVLVLFAGFLELLLPSGTMKRFVQVVVGLFVLAAILGPLGLLTSRLQQEPKLELPAIAPGATARILSDGKRLAAQQQARVLDEYRHNVARQVASLLELGGEGKVVAVKVEVEEGVDKPTFGELRSLAVRLEVPPEKTPRSVGELERLVADFYGLPATDVEVQIMRKGG